MSDATPISVEVLRPDERRGLTSASSAEADALCPGRHQAQRGLTDEGSKWTAHGNHIHEAVADLRLLLDLSPEELETAEAIIAIERRLLEKFTERFGPITQTVRERRMWLRDDDEKTRIHSGKPDVLHVAGDKAALLLDYKTLPGDVAASPGNLQLRDLAVMAWLDYDVQVVHAAVIQPLVTHRPIVTEYDSEALIRADGEMRDRIAASNRPDAPRKPGYKQCLYCRAWKSCPEAQKMAQAIVTARPKAELSRQQRLALYDFCKLVAKRAESYIHSIDADVKDNPHAWPEFKVDSRDGNRKIVDVGAASKAIAHYVTPGDFLTACSVTMKNITTVWCAAYQERNGGTKKDAEAAMEQALGAAMGRGKPVTTLTYLRAALPSVETPSALPAD